MITSFPSLYPDELLYSLFARYYAQSGHIAYAFAAEDLFERRTTKPDIEFIDKLTPEAFDCIMKNMPLETAVMQHTMFPYYSRFLPMLDYSWAGAALLSSRNITTRRLFSEPIELVETP